MKSDGHLAVNAEGQQRDIEGDSSPCNNCGESKDNVSEQLLQTATPAKHPTKDVVQCETVEMPVKQTPNDILDTNKTKDQDRGDMGNHKISQIEEKCSRNEETVRVTKTERTIAEKSLMSSKNAEYFRDQHLIDSENALLQNVKHLIEKNVKELNKLHEKKSIVSKIVKKEERDLRESRLQFDLATNKHASKDYEYKELIKQYPFAVGEDVSGKTRAKSKQELLDDFNKLRLKQKVLVVALPKLEKEHELKKKWNPTHPVITFSPALAHLNLLYDHYFGMSFVYKRMHKGENDAPKSHDRPMEQGGDKNFLSDKTIIDAKLMGSKEEKYSNIINEKDVRNCGVNSDENLEKLGISTKKLVKDNEKIIPKADGYIGQETIKRGKEETGNCLKEIEEKSVIYTGTKTEMKVLEPEVETGNFHSVGDAKGETIGDTRESVVDNGSGMDQSVDDIKGEIEDPFDNVKIDNEIVEGNIGKHVEDVYGEGIDSSRSKLIQSLIDRVEMFDETPRNHVQETSAETPEEHTDDTLYIHTNTKKFEDSSILQPKISANKDLNADTFDKNGKTNNFSICGTQAQKSRIPVPVRAVFIGSYSNSADCQTLILSRPVATLKPSKIPVYVGGRQKEDDNTHYTKGMEMKDKWKSANGIEDVVISELPQKCPKISQKLKSNPKGMSLEKQKNENLSTKNHRTDAKPVKLTSAPHPPKAFVKNRLTRVPHPPKASAKDQPTSRKRRLQYADSLMKKRASARNRNGNSQNNIDVQIDKNLSKPEQTFASANRNRK